MVNKIDVGASPTSSEPGRKHKTAGKHPTQIFEISLEVDART
jgi:hypothetical protein